MVASKDSLEPVETCTDQMLDCAQCKSFWGNEMVARETARAKWGSAHKNGLLNQRECSKK